MGKHLRFMGLLFFAFALILSGCSSNEEQGTNTEQNQEQEQTIEEEVKTPTEGGVLRVGVLQLPTWNPIKWNEATAQYSTAERLVYRGLFTYGEEQLLTPDLISNYTIEQLEDGKSVLRFTLDDKAKWHDGTPVSFEDVSFTLHTYLNPFYYGAWKQNLSYINGTSAYRGTKAEKISGIKQDENGEIVIEMTDATSSFYHALTAPILPAHQLKELGIEEIEQQFTDGKVVGNGPFKFESKRDTELRLQRATAFAEGGPYLDGIAFVKYSGAVSSVNANDYDLVVVPPQKQDEVAEGFKAYEVVQNVYYYLGFNAQDEVTGKKELRTAIYEAIDTEALISEALYNNGSAVSTILPTTSWLMSAEDASKSPNLESAKNRMTALGYSAQKPLKLTLHYQGDNSVVEKLVDELSKQLSAIYVQIDKKPLVGDEYYAYIFSGKPTQAFIHAWPFSKDIGYWWKLYGSYHDVMDLGLNIVRYKNTNADELLQQLYYSVPNAEQKATAVAFLNQFNEDHVVVPLFAPTQTYWVSKKVHDQVINGDGWFVDSTKWWMEN